MVGQIRNKKTELEADIVRLQRSSNAQEQHIATLEAQVCVCVCVCVHVCDLLLLLLQLLEANIPIPNPPSVDSTQYTGE